VLAGRQAGDPVVKKQSSLPSPINVIVHPPKEEAVGLLRDGPLPEYQTGKALYPHVNI
jgi:hypothetical protein